MNCNDHMGYLATRSGKERCSERELRESLAADNHSLAASYLIAGSSHCSARWRRETLRGVEGAAVVIDWTMLAVAVVILDATPIIKKTHGSVE